LSREHGGLVSLRDATLPGGAREYVTAPPRLITWRPLTDNDRGAGTGFTAAQWFGAGRFARVADHTVRMDGATGELVGETRYELAEPKRTPVTVRWRVDGDAALRLELEYEGETGPDLPLLGLEWHLPLDCANVEFYGLGPDETYADRQSGKLGVWRTAAADTAPYLVPQETGQHLYTRWAKVTDADGHGLRIDATDVAGYAFSLLPYSTLMLEEARHQGELPKPSSMVLRLIAAQDGVGGDDSWGAPVHARYRVRARARTLVVRISMI
ncbi:MAG: beta-galactosidase small subunit, partial [Bifidobacterium sp.]|nr:beta-galactosidase small subunit [Bifidobacterium sp.]